MTAIDVRTTLTACCAAITAKRWDEVDAHLADDTTWFAGGQQHSGRAAVRSFLEDVVAKGFDREGAKTGEVEILEGEHHHGMFWPFNATIDGEVVWNHEIWLAELTADGRIGAVFVFAESADLQRRFWA